MNRNLKITLAAALIYAMGAFSAFAQSSPNWSYGYVPTPAEWNLWFSKKMDYNGVSACLITGCTYTGPVITSPSTSNTTGFNISPGVAPSAPNNGDMWVTAAGIFVQINGVTVQLSGGGATIGVGGTNQIAYYTAPSTINGIATANNGVLVTNGSGAPSISTTLPSGLSAANMSLSSPTMTTPTLGVAAGTSLALGGATIGSAALAMNGFEVIVSASSQAFSVGPNGATNPTFQVNDSVASQASGILVQGAAAGGGASITTIDSASNSSLTLNGKGTGLVAIGSLSSGGVSIGGGGGGVTLNGAVSLAANNLVSSAALGVFTSTALTTAQGIEVNSLLVNSSYAGGLPAAGVVNVGTGFEIGGAAATGNYLRGNGTNFVSSAFQMGDLTYATGAQVIAGTATNVVIQPSVIYSAETTTTFGATTTFDFSTFINTAVTLTGNITTQTLNNVKAGQAGQIRFIQDGTGSRTTVWNSIFKFAGGTVPSLTTAANAIDVLFYSCVSASLCYASLTQNMH